MPIKSCSVMCSLEFVNCYFCFPPGCLVFHEASYGIPCSRFFKCVGFRTPKASKRGAHHRFPYCANV